MDRAANYEIGIVETGLALVSRASARRWPAARERAATLTRPRPNDGRAPQHSSPLRPRVAPAARAARARRPGHRQRTRVDVQVGPHRRRSLTGVVSTPDLTQTATRPRSTFTVRTEGSPRGGVPRVFRDPYIKTAEVEFC